MTEGQRGYWHLPDRASPGCIAFSYSARPHSVGGGGPGVWEVMGHMCRKLQVPGVGPLVTCHFWDLAAPSQAPVSSEVSPRSTPEGAF
jgi:hypothetical protein